MSPSPDESPGESSLEALVTRSLGLDASLDLAELLPVLVRDVGEIDWRLNEVLGSTYAQLTEAARYACSTGASGSGRC